MKLDTQFKNAKIKTSSFYNSLVNPKYLGQTKANSEGNYTVYISSMGETYGIKMNIFN
jgi:hypothetical protein